MENFIFCVVTLEAKKCLVGNNSFTVTVGENSRKKILKDIFCSRSKDTSKNLSKTQQVVIAQKIKFPIKDFFSKCDHMRRKLWVWSHLLQKSLMENFIFAQCVQNFLVSDLFGNRLLKLLLQSTPSQMFAGVLDTSLTTTLMRPLITFLRNCKVD